MKSAGAVAAVLTMLSVPAFAEPCTDDSILCQYRAEKKAAIEEKCKRLGGVRVGMTLVQVEKSCWGKPKRVNETRNARGTHEQWVYPGGYLYLDDGVLTSIQTSR